MHILICDDDKKFIEEAASFLEQKGHHLYSVSTPEAVPGLLGRQPDISVVLVSWVLGGRESKDLCKALKKGISERYIYVIVMSEKERIQSLVKILSVGADDFVPKPVDLKELNARIKVASRIVNLEKKYKRSLQEARVLNRELVKSNEEIKRTHSQLLQQEKLFSVGQLAAGIAHEINTPIQYVSDNARFLQDSFSGLDRLLVKYQSLLKTVSCSDLDELTRDITEFADEIDLEFLREEIPEAIKQAQGGVDRVAGIVRALKEFSQPNASVKTLTDINRIIENTCTVARSDWSAVADMVTDLDPALPEVECIPSDLSQVLLSMVVNAAQAVRDKQEGSPGQKGTITISTRLDGGEVEIRIQDTGTGIPEEARGRVFDPFYTTREVGSGTGQGLAISYVVIVKKHKGAVSFETETGQGTTFIVRLPVTESGQAQEEAV